MAVYSSSTSPFEMILLRFRLGFLIFSIAVPDLAIMRIICLPTVQIRVWLDCEAISSPGPRRRALEKVRTAGLPRASFTSSLATSIASRKYRFLDFIAYKYFQAVGPSKPEELNGFLQYLKDVRNVLFVDFQPWSLIITLQCSSLEILDGLWEDYCSGYLDRVAQKYLVTEEALREFYLIEVKLKTTILEAEYNHYREYFLESEGEFRRLLHFYTQVFRYMVFDTLLSMSGNLISDPIEHFSKLTSVKKIFFHRPCDV